ncbi:MAG: hypothetical protein P8Z31_02285 [Gammaproteobacteria bacterium]|jgi:hypothetical protein
MRLKLTILLPLLLAAGRASAHASHAPAALHEFEHLLLLSLLSLLLAPALLFLRPAMRRLAAGRAR